MKTIELNIDWTESMQFIEQQETVFLDDGSTAEISIFAEVTIYDNVPISFYDERQQSVKVENLEIEILELWNKIGEKITLDDSAEKEIKQQILENIE